MSTILKLLPSLFRVGVVLLVFWAGYWTCSTKNANEKLKEENRVVIEGSKSTAEYISESEELRRKIEKLKEKGRRDETPDCNAVIPPCLSEFFDELQRTR